jgi:hypothetical protein
MRAAVRVDAERGAPLEQGPRDQELVEQVGVVVEVVRAEPLPVQRSHEIEKARRYGSLVQ